MVESACLRTGAVFMPAMEAAPPYRTNQLSSSVLRPRPAGGVFAATGTVEARRQKRRRSPAIKAGAKPQTGSRGVPGRTPCRRQGIVRYTASTTARENARPALMGPGVFVGGETAAAQVICSAETFLRRVPFGGVVCEKSWRSLPCYPHQEGVNTDGQKSCSDRGRRRSV